VRTAILVAAVSVAGTWGELDPAVKDRIKSSVDVGLKYIRFQQKKNGSWNDSPRTTALVVRALMESHRRYTEEDGPFVRKALEYLAASAQPDGVVQGEDSTLLDTALVLHVLSLSGNPAYRGLIDGAKRYVYETKGALVNDPLFLAGAPLEGSYRAYYSMARDADGAEKERLAQELLAAQQFEGYWKATSKDRLESDDIAASAVALLALERIYED